MRTSNGPFDWSSRSAAFYDLLARGFAAGHLYVPVEPSPRLLALPDPWDPARNGEYGIQDMALYNRRYYVYHGAAPALLLFTPWLLLTGRDLPESFAGLLFCFLGYLCWCGTLIRVLSWMELRPPPAVLSLLLLALGICQCVPFLLQRVIVYEVAIAAGYCTLAAGFLLLARALLAPRAGIVPLVLSGLSLGLAIGCRPHLAWGALLVFSMLALLRLQRRSVTTRHVIAFTVPAAACVLLLGYYNYARFHDPLEFGMRYELASPAYFRPLVSFANFRVGMYYLFACPPDIDGIFPFFRLLLRAPFKLPQRYFLEPIAGIFLFTPFAAASAAWPWMLRRYRNRSPVHSLVAVICLSALASAGTIAALGLVSQRYEVDFLPSLVFAACLLMAAVEARPAVLNRGMRALSRVLLVPALVYSMAAGLALGIQGPYDEFAQKHPQAYVGLARWFSPVRRFRPVENPRINVEATFEFPAGASAGESPLVAAGRFGTRFLLTATPLPGDRLRLNASTALTTGVVASTEVTMLRSGPNRLRLHYDPAARTITVAWNGAAVLLHRLPWLITAPAQVTVGEDHTGIDSWPARFTGRVTHQSKWIDGVGYR